MCDCYIKKKHIKSQDIARKIASPPIELYHPMISSKGCSAPAVGSIMTLKILIFHTTLDAHFAMLIRSSHTDQLPVNHLGIPDPSLPCEGGAADGSTSSESYPLSLKLWFETILKIVHIFVKQL